MNNQSRLRVVNANIVKLEVDVIVNAANTALLAGGGVCGAIHTAAGPELARECSKIGGCEVGYAVATPAFKLASKWIVHAVGPVWEDGASGEDDLLASCYQSSLELARDLEADSIAFPAISTGIYRFPPERAATIAAHAAADFIAKNKTPHEIIFCCFDEKSAALHRTALSSL